MAGSVLEIRATCHTSAHARSRALIGGTCATGPSEGVKPGTAANGVGRRLVIFRGDGLGCVTVLSCRITCLEVPGNAAGIVRDVGFI